jgi:hypothetical protein
MDRRPIQNRVIDQRIEFAVQCFGALVVIALITLVETSAQVYFHPESFAVLLDMQPGHVVEALR